MKSNIKNVILRLFIGMAVGMSIGMNCFSLICHNGAGGGGGTGDGTTVIIDPIEPLVTEGAGYYLQAESLTKALLYRVELQSTKGIDYAEMRQVAGNALDNITRARATYEKLVKTAKEYTFNWEFIGKLKSFDYPGFRLEKGLNETIFNKVEKYLSQGDIPGVLYSSYSDIVEIENILIFVNKELGVDRLPALPVLWEMNEKFSKASLFGSYSTRIFYAVR